MAYGSPRNASEIKRYLTSVMGGSEPNAVVVRDFANRYLAIGGISPLIGITESQANGLRMLIDPNAANTRVYFGMRHSEPYISGAVERAAIDGVETLKCIAMAPHYSVTSTEAYFDVVNKAIGSGKTTPSFVRSWHLNANLVSFWAQSVKQASKGLEDPFVIFSAHSLQEEAERESPYRAQLNETAEAIANEAGIADWTLAFQSRGARGDGWYGPTVEEAVRGSGRNGPFVIAPIGFVSDNLEILYDIDIKYMGWAKERGMEMRRARMPNDSELLIRALADLVRGENTG